MTSFERTVDLTKRPKEYVPGAVYCELTDARGVSLCIHTSRDDADEFHVNACNQRGDYRPALLDLAQLRALRDACDLILAEHAATTSNEPTPAMAGVDD